MEISKFANGGRYAWAYTSYNPAIYEEQSRGSSTARSSKSSSDDEKGKISDKDILLMLDNADMLDNERDFVTNKILLLLTSPTFDSERGLNSKLTSLVLIKNYIGKFINNKKDYDKAVELAIKHQSLNEPAIDKYGRLLTISENGNIEYKDLSEVDDTTQILTVNDLKQYRERSSNSINDASIIDIIHNSVGIESFLDTVNKLKIDLGHNQNIIGQTSSSGKNVERGLEILESLLNDPRFDELSPQSLAELNKYQILDLNQIKQIEHLVNYITALLPKNYQTWAAYKLGMSDRHAATKTLVEELLLAGNTTIKKFSIGLNTANNSKNNTLSDIDKLDYDWWSLVLTGTGGNPISLRLNQGNQGNYIVEGRHYSAVPEIELDVSLTDFINNSNGGHMINNKNNITIGDIPIDLRSFNKVLIENKGATVVVLPVKADGTVRLNIIEEYEYVIKKLKESGLKEGTQQYKNKLQELCEDNGISDIVDYTTGKFKESALGTFMILEGMVDGNSIGTQYSDPSKNIVGGPKSFKDINSDWIVETEDASDISIYKQTIDPKFDDFNPLNPFDWTFFGLIEAYDRLYKGNIYIPLSINPLDALNADKNHVKRNVGITIDNEFYNKTKNSGTTNSSLI